MTAPNNRPNYYEMAALGLARSAATFPIEHALERLKIEAQAKSQLTTKEALTNLWKSQGFKGVYAGSRANFLRKTIRETYHGQ